MILKITHWWHRSQPRENGRQRETGFDEKSTHRGDYLFGKWSSRCVFFFSMVFHFPPMPLAERAVTSDSYISERQQNVCLDWSLSFYLYFRSFVCSEHSNTLSLYFPAPCLWFDLTRRAPDWPLQKLTADAEHKIWKKSHSFCQTNDKGSVKIIFFRISSRFCPSVQFIPLWLC